MLGIKMTGQVPFKEIYCHGLIRDADGRKMSKSLGNVIDPIDIIDGISLDELNGKLRSSNLDEKEIKRVAKANEITYPEGLEAQGVDPLRFALINYTSGNGEDIKFDVSAVQTAHKFGNKIFNAFKYLSSKLNEDSKFTPQPTPTTQPQHPRSPAERWILHRFTICSGEINRALDSREFSTATQVARSYFWDELCDVYVEVSKTIIESGSQQEAESAKQTLYTALEGALLLLHPFMPFLTGKK